MASVSPNVPKFGILLSAVEAYMQNEKLQKEYWGEMQSAIVDNNFARWDFLENEVIRLQNEYHVLRRRLVCAGVDPRSLPLLQ